MITVFVWDAVWSGYLPGTDRAGSPGHAAIQIDDLYVSFWPGQVAGKLRWGGYRLHSLSEDMAVYQATGQQLWRRVVPHQNGNLPGLDRPKMKERWEEIHRLNPDYSIRLQCAAVVNELLLAGGSQRFARTNLFNPSTWYLGAVSPADVRDYVTTLVAELDRLRAK